jgi:RNA polymerase sigma-70 factor, ECF subfamily
MAAPSASTSIHQGPATLAGRRQSVGHDRLAGEPIRRGGSPLAAHAPDEVRADAPINGAAPDAPHLDATSRAWLDALHSPGPRGEEAIGRLHAFLVRKARFEVGRRATSWTHRSGAELDDLAVQAADDAVVVILAKLDQFRGDSLFTTWARSFVEREAAAKTRRHLRHTRELPLDDGFEHARLWPVDDESPYDRAVARESAQTLVRLIAEVLTARQREVLFALTIEDVPTRDLARRLNTTTGALYKALHDARRKLKANLVEAAA